MPPLKPAEFKIANNAQVFIVPFLLQSDEVNLDVHWNSLLPGYMGFDSDKAGGYIIDDKLDQAPLARLAKKYNLHIVDYNAKEPPDYALVFKVENSETSSRMVSYGCLPIYGLFAFFTNANFIEVSRKAQVTVQLLQKPEKKPVAEKNLGTIVVESKFGFWGSIPKFGKWHQVNNVKLIEKALAMVTMKQNKPMRVQ